MERGASEVAAMRVHSTSARSILARCERPGGYQSVLLKSFSEARQKWRG